jgi:16S rRNA (adenine(1408)-N(1))-methyltransferase
MLIVQGKRLTDAAPDTVRTGVAGADRVVVDVGCGDARTAYRTARSHPTWLVVGLDPAWRGMCDTSTRARRKASKGGAANLMLVCGSIEDAPAELDGIGDEVWVLMPWGRLLHGIVRGDADVWQGLRRVAATGAALTVTVGTSIWRDPVPREIRELPELTPAYVGAALDPRIATFGWRLETATVTGAAATTDGDAAAGGTGGERTTAGRPPASSWSKRLGATGPEPILRLTATAVAPQPGT